MADLAVPCRGHGSMPVKVLALANMYPPHYYGGYELICRDVMERFREARPRPWRC